METTKNQAQDYADGIAEEIHEAYEDGTMSEVVENILDVAIIKGTDGEVRGVELTRTIGGPGAWINTEDRVIYCDWAGQFGHSGITPDEAAELEAYFIY